MQFDVLTLFPEMFESFLKSSILGRAVEAKKITINIFNIRDFSTDKHRKVDDVPYGGGAGMVLMCQPLFDALEYVQQTKKDQAPVLFLTPQGERFEQKLAEEFADTKKYTRLILLCGHYEGIDQRVRDTFVDREISLGDFVLTGGELPAQVFIDAVSRLIPGVLGKEESTHEESFSAALNRKLEYPHYTRPEVFQGKKVPDVLLSGHHAKIKEWREQHCRHPRKKM